ncbi:ATP-binding cassette domain-containing protein [Kiloniella antarctica]|uniref:ATP-binding cassette domain-containing protein n=1 Tax=Kiloniella antarctica TaxID=1550907 RepID=A0ABW5BMC4_9PROT
MKGNAPPPLLRLIDLTVTFNGQVLIDNINLNIKSGETLAVVGGSGAGKTTLLRSLMGLKNHDLMTSGSLAFEGNMHDLSDHQKFGSFPKHSLAYVPQSPSIGLDPLKKLKWQWQQVIRVTRPKDREFHTNERRKLEVDFPKSILTQLKLKEFGEKYPHQWSRGMQQRLLIAFALAAKPKILILDEPTSALDPIVAARALLEVVKAARENNITVLMVTHDLALAAQFADRIAVLSSGKLIELGVTDQILNSPIHPYTANLVKHRHWGNSHA